jgi:4-hydroxybutyrate CoA-transferase
VKGIRFSDADAVVRSIPDGSSVILPQGCAEPASFYQAFAAVVDGFRKLRLFSGLQFGDYAFLKRGLGKNYTYTTWHVGAPVRKLISAGRCAYLPLRYSDIARRFDRPDVVVVQVSPPGPGGEVSLGISVGATRQLALSARLVIAELSEGMPFTCGESTLPLGSIDYFIEGDSPPVACVNRPVDELSSRIAAFVSGLIPDGAWLQLGIGAVPDALLSQIMDRDINIHSGMITDQVMALLETTSARVVTAEVVGSEKLFRYVDKNPAVEVVPSSRSHDIRTLARLNRFMAVNSALEVDLSGQVNSEMLNGVTVAGVGGSLDFMLGATLSPGGKSIIALPSTASGGERSRIVPFINSGAAVTVPRQCVDFVVTEYGVAKLLGKSLPERARALTSIAHPAYRERLAKTERTGKR